VRARHVAVSTCGCQFVELLEVILKFEHIRYPAVIFFLNTTAPPNTTQPKLFASA
jgi:hypothetical protein